MPMFFYAKVANGQAQSGVAPGPEAQTWIGNTAPIDSLGADQLAAHGIVRLAATAVPRDGYRYMPGAPELVDGKWGFVWERQDTPSRDVTLASLARQRRADREDLLTKTDWTQIADAPLSADQRAAWAAYRQALRDMPTQPNFPWEVTWPVKPA